MITLDQFRDFLQSIPYPCITIYEQSRIVLSNQHAEHLFGFSQEELAGRLVDTLLPELFLDDHIRQGENTPLDNRDTGLVYEPLELVACHRNGRKFPVEIGMSSVMMNGDHFFLAIIHDITRHKQEGERLHRLLLLHEEEKSGFK